MVTARGNVCCVRNWLVLIAVALLVVTVGCTRQVTGAARQDPNQPGTAVTEDGYGILAGDPDAPAQIEVFTEPQCSHCAALQAEFGPEIASYISLGQLGVTYRPVTFLDETGDHSARVSNALFTATAARPRGVAFQSFVEDLWAHQNPGGTGPSDADMAAMAEHSGVPAPGVNAIAAGDATIDTQDMSDANIDLLAGITPYEIGTPLVHNLISGEIVDISDDDWLAKLISTV
jgi:protein-disulfide isomerase